MWRVKDARYCNKQVKCPLYIVEFAKYTIIVPLTGLLSTALIIFWQFYFVWMSGAFYNPLVACVRGRGWSFLFINLSVSLILITTLHLLLYIFLTKVYFQYVSWLSQEPPVDFVNKHSLLCICQHQLGLYPLFSFWFYLI